MTTEDLKENLSFVQIKGAEAQIEILQKQIKEARARCRHTWHLTSAPPSLIAAMQRSYYIGDISLEITHHRYILDAIHKEGFTTKFTVECSLCGAVKHTSTSATCPGCYSERRMTGWAVGRKEDYIGMDHNYFRLRVWVCSAVSSHFPILRDEWDQ